MGVAKPRVAPARPLGHHGRVVDVNQLITQSPVGFVVAFGAGVVSFLSPCVLPLVPSYLSMMSGMGASQMAAPGAGQRQLLRSTVLFVAGFTLVFLVLEATASSLGRTLRDHEGTLTVLAGVLIVLMGLMFAGLIHPAWLARERRFQVLPSRLGPWAAPVMGMAFAFGWTPCIGPALGAVLALASSGTTLARGEIMLLAYSLGLGVPFVALGVAFGRISGALRWIRQHLRAVNLVSGLALSALGVLLVTGDLHVLSTFFSNLLDHLGLSRLSTV